MYSKGISFLTYFNSTRIMRLICTSQSHIIMFQPISEFISFLHRFNDCFELNDPEIEKHYKWTLKRLKVGMVSSFHPHNIYKKVKTITAKNWMHFVYKLDNLFRSIRVSDENSSVTKALLIFLKLITTPNFFCVHCAPFKAT